MHQFRYIGLVHHVNGNSRSLTHAQQRSRRTAVVPNRADRPARRKLQNHRLDLQCEIRFRVIRSRAARWLRALRRRHLHLRLCRGLSRQQLACVCLQTCLCKSSASKRYKFSSLH